MDSSEDIGDGELGPMESNGIPFSSHDTFLSEQRPQPPQLDSSTTASQGAMDSNIEDGCSNAIDQAQEYSVPTIGMEFSMVEEAYQFYNAYALHVGFSVRRNLDRKNKSKNVTTMKSFTCNREGKPRARSPTKCLPKFQQSEQRIGCKAHMKINISSKGNYKVTSFDPNHNHDTTTPRKTKLLKSHREISKAQKAMGDLASAAGIKPKETYELLAKQAGGRRHLTFIPEDYKNYLRTKRKRAMALGDAGALMQYLQDRQKEDPSFYYAIQLDDDDQITNIFWADGRSLLDFDYFGDVVCFDSTYKTNEYGRPFAIFVGINHHKQTVIFGAALLYDETAPSFEWLFDALLKATGGKAPKVILTDQDFAMSKAIKNVLPNTTHRLCVWHMYQNAAKNLSQVFSGSTSFKQDFSHCVYDCEDVEDFQYEWKEMLKKYSLTENKWLKELFKIREKWALVYGRQVFCADMKSTQRSESINSVIKKYLDPRQRLLDFFTHWERLLEDRRHSELVADSRASQGNPKAPFSEMLKQAANLYTPSVYKVFEAEYGCFLDCSIHDNGQREHVHEYIVTRHRERIVRHDLSTDNMTCTCLKFEFMGIQCCHVLKVLDFMNIKRLPEMHFLKRWQKNAKTGKSTHLVDNEIESEVHVARRYSFLTRTYNEIFSTASHSDKAYKYALELAREAMSKVEELVSQDSESNQTDCNNLPRKESSKTASEQSKKPTSIKKKENERGRRRIPNCLEKNKRRKTGELDDISNSACTTMPSREDASKPGLTCTQTSNQTSMQGTQNFGSATELLNSMLVFNQELNLSDSQINIAQASLAGLEKKNG